MKIESTKHSLQGALSVPGSKSHTIRACLFAALGDGTSYVRNPLPSQDGLSALNIAKSFGCRVKQERDVWVIEGIGSKWPQPGFVVDCGNSGTLLYLCTGILSTIPGISIITGDKSICTRPIEDELKAIRMLGADAYTTRKEKDAPPAIIEGPVKAGTTRLKGNLSQHVSGLLLAGALTEGVTRIELEEPKEVPFVMMTVSWLESLGIHVDYDREKNSWYEIKGPNRFSAIDRAMPSDWEGVAFPLAAGILTNSPVKIENIDTSDVQGDKAIVDIFRSMGADIVLDEEECSVSVKSVRYPLKPIEANLSDYPDALPMLSVAAAFAEGTSRFTDIGVCRLKESDRIKLMHVELNRLGVDVTEGPDYLEVHGKGGRGMHGAVCESYDDHRIAMALAVCGLALPEGESIIVNDAECCSVSFPGFYDTMNSVGACFKEV